MDHSNDLKKQNGMGSQYVQYFAMGESANNLALRSDVRQAMFHRLTPQMRDSFCEDDFETKSR